VDRFPHTGHRATRDEVLAKRVMAFSSARTPAGFLLCKNLLPIPDYFVLWYFGGEVRIAYSLLERRRGAGRSARFEIPHPYP
jgi:hypothetical protein